MTMHVTPIVSCTHGLAKSDLVARSDEVMTQPLQIRTPDFGNYLCLSLDRGTIEVTSDPGAFDDM
jgi:hypothetical protein